MIHLDTSFLIRAQVRDSPEESRLAIWVSSREPLEMSSVAWGEYLCGPLLPGEEEEARTIAGHIEPLLKEDAEKAADLFNKSGRRSHSFGDCMIAAIALQRGASVATTNTADFKPFEPHGLKLA